MSEINDENERLLDIIERMLDSNAGLRDEIERLRNGNAGLRKRNERLRGENKRLQAIADEVENLHYGTDLFTSCGAGAADRLINLTEREAGDE
jgi:predicted nuclease with TOPRIM domain